MANDPVLTDQHLLEGGHAQHDIVVLEKHEAPSNAQGNATFDPFKEYDRWRAKRVMEVLQMEYPGHFWAVISDRTQGIVKISIPILMGVNHWFVINEKTHDVSPGMVIVAGAEILERYNLARGRMNVGAFLETRQKHSKLLVPSREIPE
jgi:hypothetical protein